MYNYFALCVPRNISYDLMKMRIDEFFQKKSTIEEVSKQHPDASFMFNLSCSYLVSKNSNSEKKSANLYAKSSKLMKKLEQISKSLLPKLQVCFYTIFVVDCLQRSYAN